jgi:GT2 family glycosyltransferase
VSQTQPFFSIIVPTYARPDLLAACLESLSALDYPHDRFEVIVVDDGSEAPPRDVVASFRDRLDVTLLGQPHAGPAAARNAGAARAGGEFLAFTDDDCAPEARWLPALAARLAASPDHLVGGQTLNGLPDNVYSTATHVLVDYLYACYNAAEEGACFFASNNLAVSAERFRAVGGFDTTFPHAAAEDREFCDRWLSRGYRMTYAPQALVHHSHRLTFRAFWRQHLNYGRGAFRFRKMRAHRNREERVRVEALPFYLGLLLYPFSRARPRRALALAALLMVSQAANAAGFFRERMS